MNNCDLDWNWLVLRNGRICAQAKSREDAERMIRQLRKLYPSESEWKIHYAGANISGSAIM